jgi:predicted AlkP superfamily phosphohydrolase/phosphomutase
VRHNEGGGFVKTPVVVIGLDAADPVLLEGWLDRGLLPNLARLRREGAYGRLANFEYCRAEAACATFLTGCSPAKHGYWSPYKFHPDYQVEERFNEFREHEPFYALGDGYRVAVFDMPQTRLSSHVNGVQVLGWGAHSPQCPSHSEPPEAFDELVRQHGEHPTLRKDDIHAMGDMAAMRRLKTDLETGLARRVAICRDLLARERWDLFLTYVGETHSAQHYLWHLSQADHPLYRYYGRAGDDPLLDVFQSVDRAVAEIAGAAPPDARFVIFSDHGMESNSTDLPSMVFLPELLYRLSFPGRIGLAPGRAGAPVPPVLKPSASRSWRSVLWGLKHDPNPITRWLRRRLPTSFFHYTVERRLGIPHTVPLCPENCVKGTQVPMWYHPAWPRMKAFALPSFSEGYVRINVRGREAGGLIDPAAYDATCAEIAGHLQALVNPRTGAPAVRQVLRTRQDPLERDPYLPDADLIVLWHNAPMDVVDSPAAGRIGPVPFKRSGSHVHRGFLLAAGPGIQPGALPEGHAVDIAPTILALMGAPLREGFDGQPIVRHDGHARGSARPAPAVDYMVPA